MTDMSRKEELKSTLKSTKSYEIYLSERKFSKEVYSVKQIQDFLQPVFENYNVKKAVLFGSYAKGRADDKSDVDILVDSGIKGVHFFGLLDDVVKALNKDVDLIDVRQIHSDSRIAREIEETGVVIYDKRQC